MLNTAGEREREARSRRANVLDACGAMCGALLVLWPFCFGWGVLGHTPWVSVAGKTAMFLLFVWAVLGSPLWHRDALESLGLSSPRRLFGMLRDSSGADCWRTGAVVLALFGGLLWFSLADWPDAARFFRLPKNYQVWPDSHGQWAAIALLAVAAATIVTTCAIRYDNLAPAFGLALKISIFYLAYAALAAWFARGPKAFASFEWREHSLAVAANMFWALIQQLTFTAFFATRLRKAFAPSGNPSNIVPAERRLVAVCLGAVVAAATVGPGVWVAMRTVHGPLVPLSLLPGCSAFALPAGAVWTHFFCRNKRRMLVATLNGSFFGLFHIDSYGLVLLTSILGTTFAYAAMEDRYRNLASFAFVHGLLSTTVLKLFAGKGIWHVNLSVGPWAVKHPSASVLVVPLLCLAACATLSLGKGEKWPLNPAPRPHEPS